MISAASWDKDLTGPVLETIGRAYGTWLYQQDGAGAGPARDGSDATSGWWWGATCAFRPGGLPNVDLGAASGGLRRDYIGEVPTPVLYFALGYYETDGGIEVTASHNPPEFNGLKMRKCAGAAMRRSRRPK